MHEKTHSAGVRRLVRLTSLTMARFRWQEWLDRVIEQEIRSDHAMADVSQDAASSAASAAPSQKRKYDHATAEVAAAEVSRLVASKDCRKDFDSFVLGPVANHNSSSGSDSSDASATLHQKRKNEHAATEVLRAVASQDCSSSPDARLGSRWLEELRPLLSPYDVKLLERYIPVLPPESLQKVKTEFQSDHAAYLAKNTQPTQQRPAEKIISKMSMRRILGTTFARLGLTDFHFQDIHKQWQATTTRSNRTGQQRAKHHTRQWHQRRGHHGRG